jgi:glycosyltransferase involved in cell wall biosynthesis
MKKLTHLLLVTLEDPWNALAWSGTPFHMRASLERQVDKLSVLASLKPTRNPKDVLLKLAYGRDPERYPLHLTKASQRKFARQTRKAIEQLRPDAVLSISSHCLIDLPPQSIPIFMTSDAPWLSWKETYRDFDRMPILGPRFAQREAEAARRCTGLIYPSQWAIEEAQRLYQVPRERLHLRPLGANLTPDLSNDEMSAAIDARPNDRLDLLYVGKDWERKGGPLAVEIARGLRSAGIHDVHLHIVGCTPEISPVMKGSVTVHGRLAAGDPEQASLLRQVFLTSHFLLVPTRAECYGVVFVEAHAFGLPPISRAVQAVPSIVLDGETGILEGPDQAAGVYVQRLLPLIEDRLQYRTMAHAARRRYEAQLNWGSFASGVKATIEGSL